MNGYSFQDTVTGSVTERILCGKKDCVTEGRFKGVGAEEVLKS